MSKLSLSIVIPCRNEKEYIAKCIETLLEQSKSLEKVEILVIDGMSNDGTKEEITKCFQANANVFIIENPMQITPIAFNIGIKNASCNYLMIIGARNILSSNYILEAIKDLENKPEIACSGGKVINLATNLTSKAIAIAMDSPFGVGTGNFRTLKQSQYCDTIGVPVYRKAIFDNIGLFDERLVRNQDDEFNYRLIKQKYKIWHNADIENSYYVRASFKHLFNQYQQYGYWKIFVNLLHMNITTIRQLFPFLLICNIILFTFSLFIFNFYITMIFFTPLLVYISLLIGVALFKVRLYSITLFFNVIKAFLCLHISYGWGYLLGIWHFLILKKVPTNKMTKLSR